MNQIVKQYISNVKTLFPILGKDERNYIKGLQDNILDCCNDLSSLEELYIQFGSPEEVVNLYYINADMEHINVRLQRKSFFKHCAILIAIILIITLLLHAIYSYQEYQANIIQQNVDIEHAVYE